MVGRRMKKEKFSEESRVRTRPGAASYCSSLLVLFALLPSCDIAELRCLETDGACNSALVAALFQPTKVIAIAGSGGQIWVSRDGGANYLEVIPGDPAVGYSHIKIADFRQIVVGGSNATGPYLIDSESLDTGWNPAFNTTGASLFGLDVADDGAYGACGSSSPQLEFYFSNQPGVWSAVLPAGGTPAACFYFNGSFYATLMDLSFLYIRQSDGTFSLVQSDGTSTTIDGVAKNGSSAVLVDNPNDRVFLTTDGGMNWNPHAITGGTGCSHAAFGLGIYAIYCGGTPSIVVSTDGQNWSATGIDPTTALPSIQSLSFADGYFYITGQNGSGNAAVMRTTDFFTYEPSFEGPAGIAEARDELTTFQSLIR